MGGISGVIQRTLHGTEAYGEQLPVRALVLFHGSAQHSHADLRRLSAHSSSRRHGYLVCRHFHIGKRTILTSPMQASDWNAVGFGNDCIIGGFLQLHTLEIMMLKVKLTDIQDGSSFNFGATVMSGAVIEAETTLLPLSMDLKEMYLPTATYEGSPAEPASRVQHLSPFTTQLRSSDVHPKLSGQAVTKADSQSKRLVVTDE